MAKPKLLTDFPESLKKKARENLRTRLNTAGAAGISYADVKQTVGKALGEKDVDSNVVGPLISASGGRKCDREGTARKYYLQAYLPKDCRKDSKDNSTRYGQFSPGNGRRKKDITTLKNSVVKDSPKRKRGDGLNTKQRERAGDALKKKLRQVKTKGITKNAVTRLIKKALNGRKVPNSGPILLYAGARKHITDGTTRYYLSKYKPKKDHVQPVEIVEKETKVRRYSTSRAFMSYMDDFGNLVFEGTSLKLTIKIGRKTTIISPSKITIQASLEGDYDRGDGGIPYQGEKMRITVKKGRKELIITQPYKVIVNF